MGLLYEVGDTVTLKKRPSLRQQRLGNLKSRRRFSTEMYRMRTSDHGSAQNGKKKIRKI